MEEDAKCLYIEDEEAVRDIDKAIELSLKWLNDKTDVSVELYDLLDGEDMVLCQDLVQNKMRSSTG